VLPNLYSFRGKILFFLRHNWGAAFVVLFVLLLIVSAIELSFGAIRLSNSLSIDGFYFLVIGVVLQITSSIAYGGIVRSGDPAETSRKVESTFKFRIIGAVSIILVILVGIIAFQSGASLNASGFPTTQPATILLTRTQNSTFQAEEFFSRILPEPQNQTIVAFGVAINGGSPPYTYDAVWSDGYQQTNNAGTFSRTIQAGEVIPLSANVTVTDGKGRNFTFVTRISTGSTSSSTTSTQSEHSLTFVENGLPAGTPWSTTLNGTQKMSTNKSIIFSNLKDGDYEFIVSYRFNGNIDSAYETTARSVNTTINGSDKIENITFTPLPVNQILTLLNSPSFSVTNGVVKLNVTYLENLPANLSATLVASITDNSGKLVTVTTASINVKNYSASTADLILPTLNPGRYSVSFYVLYFNQTISVESNVTFTVASN